MRRTALDRWRFLFRDVRNAIRRVYEGAAEANIPFLASALTFDALLAAIPLLLLALSLVGQLLASGADRAQLEVAEYARRLLPTAQQSGFQPVLNLLDGIARQRSALGVVGLPLFVWFSTRLFGSLRAALCEVFDTEENRSWLRGKLVDVALVLATGLLFVLNTAASEGIAILGRSNPAFGFFEFFVVQLLAFLFVLALFIIVFRFAPAHRIRWDTALVAALVCSLGFQVAKELLSLYFAHFVRPDSLVSDATLGGILLFVVWTYYMTLVFLLGSQIAQYYELRRRLSTQRLLLQ